MEISKNDRFKLAENFSSKKLSYQKRIENAGVEKKVLIIIGS